MVKSIKNLIQKIFRPPFYLIRDLLKISLYLPSTKSKEEKGMINLIKIAIKKLSRTPSFEVVRDTIKIALKWRSELLYFKEGGDEFLEYFIKLGGLNPSENVLEVGCGVGRMAVPLTKYLTSGSYDGFDIVETGIKWCKEEITSQFPNFHFRKADLYNKAYNPNGKYKASAYRFPYNDKSFDFIFLTSVFTHMLPKEVENYLAEISRVLKRNGRCLITFFLLNTESINLIKAKLIKYDFKYKYKGFRAIDKNSIETAIAYDEELIRYLYKKYGLSIVEPIHYGNWSNRQIALSHQDIIIVIKK